MAGHKQDHDFYIPSNSIWPPLSCAGLGVLMFGVVFWLHISPLLGKALFVAGLLVLIMATAQWFKTLILEARNRGFNAPPLVLELANRYGMVFFIVSELMFFAAFFAAYFYIYGFNAVWPPENIDVLDVHLPIINTLILLTSGVTVTWAHHAMLEGDRELTIKNIWATWGLGVFFLFCQMYEYGHATFGFDSGAYGSTFYLLTGFHGFHVLVGTLMLMVLHWRLKQKDFNQKHHFYFEATAWYWHFVDVVWIGLFLFVYVIPS